MINYDTIQRKKIRDRRYRLLKNWYGEERAQTEIAAHTQQPVNVSEMITQMVSELHNEEAGHYVLLESNWAQIAGEQFAAYAKPKRLQNQILYLKVRHSALIRELTPSLDLVLNELNRFFGKQVCNEIKLG